MGWVDRYIVDGVLNVVSVWTVTTGDEMRTIQTGRAQDYVYGLAVGLLLLLCVLVTDVNGFPILSVMTWAPFIAALAVMFFARRNPLLVRLLSLAGASVSLIASLWIYVTYDRVTAGFQFQESLPLVPSLGISYFFGIDGMSALMCLLTSIIIFAGVFASWTVKERSQEFYALLLILVTGVYGVFVSLDLFVFFLFYEIAVLPMYLPIGIWGSSGEVQAARDLRLGTRPNRRRHKRIQRR